MYLCYMMFTAVTGRVVTLKCYPKDFLSMKKRLTDLHVKRMQPSDRRVEIPAGPPAGFYLIVQPSGSKSWSLRYRWNGFPRKLTLKGTYPDLGLAAARSEALSALANLENGIDPAIAKAADEELSRPHSVREVTEEWIRRKVKGTRTASEVERIVNKEIVAEWKHKTISEVGRADVLSLLDAIVDRGAPVTANRTRSILLRLFGWCLERGHVEVSPIANIKPPVREKSRKRVLSEDELREIWLAADSLGFPFGPFFRFLILTAQRRGEVATVQWHDVDVDGALWTLPAERTKADRIHDVPLSPPALALLKSLPHFKGPHVFTTTSGKKAINGFSKAKAALDAAILKARGNSLADWTVHDLRRTVASHMASPKIGVAPHVLSALLNHSPGKSQGVTAVYNRYDYLEERRQAVNLWADYVLKLAKGNAQPAQKRRLAAV